MRASIAILGGRLKIGLACDWSQTQEVAVSSQSQEVAEPDNQMVAVLIPAVAMSEPHLRGVDCKHACLFIHDPGHRPGLPLKCN